MARNTVHQQSSKNYNIRSEQGVLKSQHDDPLAKNPFHPTKKEIDNHPGLAMLFTPGFDQQRAVDWQYKANEVKTGGNDSTIPCFPGQIVPWETRTSGESQRRTRPSPENVFRDPGGDCHRNPSNERAAGDLYLRKWESLRRQLEPTLDPRTGGARRGIRHPVSASEPGNPQIRYETAPSFGSSGRRRKHLKTQTFSAPIRKSSKWSAADGLIAADIQTEQSPWATADGPSWPVISPY